MATLFKPPAFPGAILPCKQEPVIDAKCQNVQKSEDADALDLAAHAPPAAFRRFVYKEDTGKVRKRIQPARQHFLVERRAFMAYEQSFHRIRDIYYNLFISVVLLRCAEWERWFCVQRK